ncbi:MAG: PhoH family protein [Gemmatimonadetes bacterium]|jgi:PhoH-like ATPase|nr:PhoH family protein [Gemmatimonadota bacterium]
MPRPKKKVFVLDTNVILHDSSCLHHFEEHDVVVPIVVLEELDQFKKGNETLNYHAREFLRALDALSGDKLFNGGVELGPGQGKISLRLESEFHPDLTPSFSPAKPDHHILNAAYQITTGKPARQAILVSKDVNLRMKAKSIGLMAQDYRNDQVADVSALYTGSRTEENVDSELIDRLYRDPFTLDPTELDLEDAPRPNEYLILRNGRKSALATFDAADNAVRHVDKLSAYGIIPRNAEQTFALHALLDDRIQLVTLSGKAGTGKTLLALAAALQRRKSYRQIFMARPVVPLSNKDLGFLPGDIDSKIAPYMQPLYDNLGVIQDQYQTTESKHRRIDDFLEEEKLVISPLAYIRGRSLVRVYFIVDEAQNLTPHEVKTIITRAGEGTKIVFTGDIFQIDHPYLDSQANGLSYLIEKMQGQPIYAHVNLQKGERSPLAELASNLL